MIKIILVLIIAGAIYTALNWETLSPKMGQALHGASEMMEKGDEMHEKVTEELENTKEKIDDVKDSLGEFIEKNNLDK